MVAKHPFLSLVAKWLEAEHLATSPASSFGANAIDGSGALSNFSLKTSSPAVCYVTLPALVNGENQVVLLFLFTPRLPPCSTSADFL